MSHINKVVWSEGMFLRPQHFQQQERHVESNLRRCIAALSGFFWGFSTLDVDSEALNLGTVRVRQARGLMPDGLPFDFVADAIEPPALNFPAGKRDARVCLVLPPAQEGVENVIYNESATSAARFLAVNFEIGDGNESGAQAAEIQVGRPRFRLMLEDDVPHGWTHMGVVRIIERQTNNALLVDQGYIPPTLDCGTQQRLLGYVAELEGLLKQRGDVLARQLSAGGRGGISEVGEFLILTLINRWQPMFEHLQGVSPLHPERLFAQMICLGGELASFSETDRRTPKCPTYVHDNLQLSFDPLMVRLRKSLAIVLDQTVVRIELELRKYGIRTAVVPDRALFRQASFVLAVNADMASEKLQVMFPAQAKIGPVEKIRDLINLQLPGIALRLLPVAPRELPFHSGYCYFELDIRHELWKGMESSAALALHIAGEFPNMALEFWAIRK